jgi:hypothetical protein
MSSAKEADDIESKLNFLKFLFLCELIQRSTFALADDSSTGIYH